MVLNLAVDIKHGKPAEEGLIDRLSDYSITLEEIDDLSKLRSKNFDACAVFDVSSNFNTYDAKEMFSFSDHLGGLLFSFSFGSFRDYDVITDARLRNYMQDYNFWKLILNAYVSRVKFDSLHFYLNKNRQPAEIVTTDGEKYQVTELLLPKEKAIIKSAFARNSPFNFPESTQLYIGDEDRKEGESFYITSEHAIPILARKIIPSEDLLSSQELLQKYLQPKIPEGKILSKSSIEYLNNILRADFNTSQPVGILNNLIDEQHVKDFFPELRPIGLVAAFVGWLPDNLHAEQNAPYIAPILGHIGRRKGGSIKLKEKIISAEEQTKISIEEQSEMSEEDTELIKGVWKPRS